MNFLKKQFGFLSDVDIVLALAFSIDVHFGGAGTFSLDLYQSFLPKGPFWSILVMVANGTFILISQSENLFYIIFQDAINVPIIQCVYVLTAIKYMMSSRHVSQVKSNKKCLLCHVNLKLILKNTKSWNSIDCACVCRHCLRPSKHCPVCQFEVKSHFTLLIMMPMVLLILPSLVCSSSVSILQSQLKDLVSSDVLYNVIICIQFILDFLPISRRCYFVLSTLLIFYVIARDIWKLHMLLKKNFIYKFPSILFLVRINLTNVFTINLHD